MKLRLLMVEDSESDAKLIVRHLLKAGYEVCYERVETASHMKAALLKQTWDLIICDYCLPEFDAPAALELVKQQSGLDLPFLVVSGTIGEEIAVVMMKAGVHDYLMKNNLTRLAPAIERELRDAQVRRDRRLADEALKASERKYRILAENTKDIIYQVDAEGIFTYVSPMISHYGYKQDDIIGHNLVEFIYPDDCEKLKNEFIETITTGREVVSEFRILTPQNCEVWLEENGKVLRDKEGRVIGVTGVLRDITDKKKAELALKEREAFFRSLIAATPAGVGFIKNRVFISVSASMCRIMGYSEEEIIGRDTRILYPDEEEYTRIGTELYGQMEWEGLGVQEARLRRKDGKIINVIFCLSPFDPNDTTAGVCATVLDITEREQAEQALRESEERFRAFAENSPDTIMRFDSECRHLYVNPVTERQTGIPAKEFIGKTHVEMGFPGYLANLWEDAIRKVFLTKSMNRVEFMLPNKIWIDWLLVPEFDTQGEVKAVITSGRDITERKTAQERERWQQEQLLNADKLSSLGTLVAGVAHEINNPNMFIMLNTSALEETVKRIMSLVEVNLKDAVPQDKAVIVDLKQDADETFKNILQGAERIKHIVEELKEFSKDKPLELVDGIDVNRVIKSAITLTWNKIKNATDNFRFEEGQNLPLVKGSSQKIEQVVINLLVNACDAMSDKKKAIVISSLYDESSCRLMVRIKDEGLGMSDNTLKHIKEPFFTTKKSTGGTGLGISISTQIIEKHNGKLEFESSPGAGTTAVISLPVDRKAEK